jgi:hypothetical protein
MHRGRNRRTTRSITRKHKNTLHQVIISVSRRQNLTSRERLEPTSNHQSAT